MIITYQCQATVNPRMAACFHSVITNLPSKQLGTKPNLLLLPQKIFKMTSAELKISAAIQVHLSDKYLL